MALDLSTEELRQLAQLLTPLIDVEMLGKVQRLDNWPHYLALDRQDVHGTTLVQGDLVGWNNTNKRWERLAILPIANGGTNSGAALNNNRIMVSSAGAIIEAGAMTNGQLLIGSTGAAQVVAALTAGSGITVTNGAGSITIASSAGAAGVSVLSANSGSNTVVAASETDLMTYSMPANTMGANNDSVRITAWGKTAANGNTKTIKVYFGATVILDTSKTTTAPNNNDWFLQCVVIRKTNASQDSGGFYSFDQNENAAKSVGMTETLSGAVTIKLTGQGGLSGDITQEAMIIEKLPAP